MTIKVLLVDDQMLVREGIKSLLNLSEKVRVVDEACDGTEVEDKVKQSAPDIILLDLSMPRMDGIATLNMMEEKKIEVPVIILTTFDDHDFILRGLQAGAKGYLLKDVSLATLIKGIEDVCSGKRLTQPALTARLLEGLKGMSSDFESIDKYEPLSNKETEVLGLMASGCSNREISQALNKSEGTIKNHVSSVLAKLGVRDRTRAVLLAIERGMI